MDSKYLCIMYSQYTHISIMTYSNRNKYPAGLRNPWMLNLNIYIILFIAAIYYTTKQNINVSLFGRVALERAT